MHQGATWDDRGDNKNVTPREEMNTSQTWQVVSQQSNATKCGQITDDLSLLLKKTLRLVLNTLKIAGKKKKNDFTLLSFILALSLTWSTQSRR